LTDPPIIWVVIGYGEERIQGDRREDRRYPFELVLRFRWHRGGAEYAGAGLTRDLSRKGICFVTDDPPPCQAEVELRIAWPFLLQNVCPLELWIWGRVLRSWDGETAVRISRYEFRTCGARSFDEAIPRPANWSIVA